MSGAPILKLNITSIMFIKLWEVKIPFVINIRFIVQPYSTKAERQSNPHSVFVRFTQNRRNNATLPH